ncbi:4487_t:CDS:2, partial [Funneliformis mosseae]
EEHTPTPSKWWWWYKYETITREHENLPDEMKEFDRWNSFINILVVVVWVCSIVLPNIKLKIQDIQGIDDEEPPR